MREALSSAVRLCPALVKVREMMTSQLRCFSSSVWSALCFAHTTLLTRGVAIGGSGVSDEPPPPTGRKRSAKVVFFFFFFFFWAGSHKKASSLKRTKGRRQQKTSHARPVKSCMASLTFAQTPSPPKKTSRRPICARRGVARCECQIKRRPIGRYTVELSISTASVQQETKSA